MSQFMCVQRALFIVYLQGLLVALWASVSLGFSFSSPLPHRRARRDTHTPPSILSRAFEHPEVAALFAFSLISEGLIHVHSICVPGVL